MKGRSVLVVTAMVLVAGCGGDATPTSPSLPSAVVSPAGRWSGSIVDAISGEGTAQLSLTEEAPNSLTGSWSMTFKNGDAFAGEAVAGLFASPGYGLMLYVDPLPACAGNSTTTSAPLVFTLINVAVTSSRLTAVAGRTSCNGPSFGTVSLSRQ